jgi:hypothetical protein
MKGNSLPKEYMMVVLFFKVQNYEVKQLRRLLKSSAVRVTIVNQKHKKCEFTILLIFILEYAQNSESPRRIVVCYL